MAENDVTMQATGGSTQQRFETVRQQISRDYVAPAMDTVRETIHDRPMSSVATVFGAGVAVGVVLALTLAPAPRRRPQSAVERLGEQVLDAVSRMLPESVASHLQR